MSARALSRRALALCLVALLLIPVMPRTARSYVLNRTVGDMRLPPSQSGGTACPQLNRFNTAVPGILDRRWSTVLGNNVITVNTLASERLSEVEQVVRESFDVWGGVAGVRLSGAFGTLARTPSQTACLSNDGLNTICFSQDDVLFPSGVLAMTRVVTTDRLGEPPFPGNPPTTFIGEILDADVLFAPNLTGLRFATPGALGANANAFDLESVLTHELGHALGFGHSGVWRAMMFPFAPPLGTFLGDRPSAQAPDAPLADDDRTGLRILYPDTADTIHVGQISGRVLPANPLSLADEPPGVSGIFGAHLVVTDAQTGAVVASTVGGWSCSGSGPAQFDGTYRLERLPVGPNRTYTVYVEPLGGVVGTGPFDASLAALCRNASTDDGWPAPFACTVPELNTNFVTRPRPPS